MRRLSFDGTVWFSPQGNKLLLLILTTLFLGCASAAKRYEQGSKLEEQGRLPEASQRYIEALRKDPGLVEARTRLESIAPKLIDEYLQRARRFSALGHALRAADLYRTIDVFVRDAGNVGVPVVRPQGYASERRAAFDAAIDQLMRTGADKESRQDWSAAFAAYSQIESYAPSREQEATVLDARIRGLTDWSEADLESGHYRAAVEHADQLIALVGSEGATARFARDLRQEAVERGTQHVVVAPLWRDDAARHALSQELSGDFLEALNDELELRYWSEPPLFVAVMEQVEVRRELRLQGLSRSVLSTREATRLGRALDADLVVTGEIETFQTTESGVSEQARTARTASGDDATYLVRKGKRQYQLRVTYVLVETQRSRQLREKTVEVAESLRFHEADYDGDEDELELSGADRRLFDSSRDREDVYDLEQRLLEKAAERIAEKVYKDILKRVK